MLKIGLKIAFALFYITVAYAGGECPQIFYCYHHCGDIGQPHPQIAACSLLSGGNYSLLSNPASSTIDCNSISTGYPQCPRNYKTVFFTDPSIVKDPKTNTYGCKGYDNPSSASNQVVQAIQKCPS
ncbi:MAG: hypothetical protein JSR85_06950 [Proteobacteria bacterium]|nr:hypothetical protein [Pseudomonadota bacterium]